MAKTEDGYRAVSQVFRALAEPRMVDGVHFSIFMINTGLLFFVLTSFKFFYWIPIYWVLHKGLGFLGKKDPGVIQFYVRYVMQSMRYAPWPTPTQRLGKRPIGFGREEPI